MVEVPSKEEFDALVTKVTDLETAVNSILELKPVPEPEPVDPEPTPDPDPVDPEPEPTGRLYEEAQKAGVQEGVTFTEVESLTITENGAVIENAIVNGNIDVAAWDVTLRNVKAASGTGSYVVNLMKGFGGLLIEHSEFVATGAANGVIGGIGDHGGSRSQKAGDNITVRYTKIWNTGAGSDGIKVANYGLYEYNHIRMKRAEGSEKHLDGYQASGRHDFVIRGSDVVHEQRTGQVIFVQAYTGASDTPVYNTLVEGNYLDGGVNTLHAGPGKTNRSMQEMWTGNNVAKDNYFGRNFKYNAVSGTAKAGWSEGNIGFWADSGEPVVEGR